MKEVYKLKQYIIGIDSGTSGIKAVLFDTDGNEIAKKGFPIQAYIPREDMYEEDMNEIWDKAKTCVREVAKTVEKSQIVGLGMTAQADGLWIVDEQMRPVRRGCCFCDGRAGEFVEQWQQDGTSEKLFEATGTWIFTGNQNGIVRWMDKYEPETMEKGRWFLHLKDYLFYQFTGIISTDASDQSLILLDQNKRDYLDEAFRICGIEKYRDRYAPILPAKENAGPIRPELAKELGLPEGLLVTSGPTDVDACALGSGVVEKGECCSIMGTAALHEMVLDKPLQDDIHSGMTMTHVMEGRWLRLMASLAGTPNLEWMLNTMGGQIHEEAAKQGKDVYTYMEDLIETVPIGSNGVMYHPYLLTGGERAPFTEPRARASYTGLSFRNTLADIVRATYEGVAFAMLDCYSHMPLPVKRIVVCGGGAKSAVWCQIFADAVGMEITTIKGEELGARGVMMNNAVVQGIYSDYNEAVNKIVQVDKVYKPVPENHEQYLKFYDLYKDIRISLQDTWKKRAKLFEE